MKEPMRKISLLVFYRDKQQVVKDLQELGMMHLQTEHVVNQELEQLNHQKNLYHKAKDLLQADKNDDKGRELPDHQLAEQERDQILHHQHQIEELEQQIEVLKKEKQVLLPWGRFDRDRLLKLEQQGLHFKFFNAPAREYRQYDFSQTYQFEIQSQKSGIYFVVIEKDEAVDIPFDQVQLPEKTLDQLDQKMKEKQDQIEKLRKTFTEKAAWAAVFEQEIIRLEDQINYITANHSFETYAEGKILHLIGWIPVSIETKVKDYLDQKHITYLIEKPKKGDQIPVILKNPKYSRTFEPITRIFQLPDYYELDLTPLIAVFYPIFFAYCLGDSGYGIIILTVSIIGMYTFLKNSRTIAYLGMVLGVVAAILGIIKSGTLFGIPIVENQDVPLFNYLSQFILIPDDQDYVFNAFNVALMIGLFQIITGVILAIIRKIKYESFLASLATFGKLIVIVSAVTLFLGLAQEVALFQPYSDLAWILLISGLVMVLLFHDLEQPVLKRIGSGFLPVYFIFTGLLGDTLSYIRLFALGIASSILGLVVNQIGQQIMSGGGIMFGVAILFLIFGHGLNLGLATLGSFVHPLRLTFVEFYNNAEFKGGGIPFKPFKKQYAVKQNN